MLDEIQELPTSADCCGPTFCDKCVSFADFMARARLLYPDMGGQLKTNGVFDGVMSSLARPLFDLYKDGLCNLERELNPCKACFMTDCWAEEYGITDDSVSCFRNEIWNPCWLTETERRVSIKAQVCAAMQLEWNNHMDCAFFENVGDQLGVKFKISAPTPAHRWSSTPFCDIVMDWPIDDELAKHADTNQLMAMLVDPDACFYRPKVCFQIYCAPKNLYATDCPPHEGRFEWNPYVDAFKCLVEEYLPCHFGVRFEENITDQCEPAALDSLCPDESGLYKTRELKGAGVPDDPYYIDWSSISPSTAATIVRRMKCLGAI